MVLFGAVPLPLSANATLIMNHAEITAIVAPNGYGVGVWPNPFAESQAEWKRRRETLAIRETITRKIEMLMEPRFVTCPETSQVIESLITMTDSRKVLEIGTCTGMGTLHMLRALVGKQGSKVISIDARPAHDRAFWRQFEPQLEFVEGWTPAILTDIRIVQHAPFDLVFIDSDHSLEHTKIELEAVWKLTRKGSVILFHDMPEWIRPDNRQEPTVRRWLKEQIKSGFLSGVLLPSCEQADCLDAWGPGYPKECNPGLGITIREV